MIVTIEPGIYEHFKGQRYEVFGTARHSETEEVFVSYRKLYDDYSFWVRPVAMFVGDVERDGYSGPRFRRIVEDGTSPRPDAHPSLTSPKFGRNNQVGT